MVRMIGAGGSPLDLRGPREGRQGRGDPFVDALATAVLLGLELLPVDEDLVCPGDVDVTEHVGMTVDQLPDQSVGDVVDVPSAFVGRDLSVEGDLQQEIAELVTHGSVVVGVDRRQELVGLLQEMAREANTLGSKSQDVKLSHLVVDIKSELEKLREQVQNVE